LINRAVFLWTIVLFVNLVVYLSIRVLLESENVLQYLSGDILRYYLFVVRIYLCGIALVYAMFFILKILGKDISEDILIFGIFAALFNYVHLARFFGPLFVLIAPLFLIISVTNISTLLGPRTGFAGLIISIVLYGGELALEGAGVLSALPVVLPSAPFNEVLTQPTLFMILAVTLVVMLGLFGWIVVRVTGLLEQKRQETERLMNEKDRFFSMISHDLRTPMTAITGYTSLLLDKSFHLDESRRRKYLNCIDEESERLVRLVDNILDFKQIEEGGLELRRENVNLTRVVEDSAKVFWAAAGRKKQKLETELPEEEFVVRADGDRLAQVVANLISNAVKFTPEGGRILVAMETFKEKNKTFAKVSFSDNGPGIPDEHVDKLFRRFQRLGSAGGRMMEGSGLGLALVKEIITQHGGEVGVESRPGGGSCFYFILEGAPTGPQGQGDVK